MADRPSPSPSDKAGTARSRSSAVTRASAAKRLGMERVEWSRGGSRSQAGGSAQLRGREASAASARRREAVNTSLSRVRASAGGAGQPAQVLSVVPESGDSPTLSKSASGPVYLVSPKRKKASEKLKNTGSHDIHTTGVRIVKGEIFAKPHSLSKKPFVRREDPSTPYGSHNRILNAASKRSEAGERFKMRRPQSAGSWLKEPVPYSMNAPRNRLPVDFGKQTKFNQSGLDLRYGVDAVGKPAHPFESVARASQIPTAKPMESRTGFTNPAITAERARFEKRFVIE